MAEIDQEEFPDDEEEEEEEAEEDARHRLKTNVIEKYDEQTESILNIQVSHNMQCLRTCTCIVGFTMLPQMVSHIRMSIRTVV